jgi:hypothetical protein
VATSANDLLLDVFPPRPARAGFADEGSDILTSTGKLLFIVKRNEPGLAFLIRHK